MTSPRSIVITGASSGIGAALALRLAASGTHMALLGRDVARLEGVAEACRRQGAVCQTAAIDVRDTPAISSFVKEVDSQQPVDLLIANAGILDGRRADQVVEESAVARQVIETNLLAAIDVVHHLLPGMRQRRNGSIALAASLARSFRFLGHPLARRGGRRRRAGRCRVTCGPYYFTDSKTDLRKSQLASRQPT